MTDGASAQAFADYETYVSPGKAGLFRAAGIEFVMGRRAGPFMWNLEGTKRLINCHSNGGVFNLGHRHPEIVAALETALAEVDIGNHHFVSDRRGRLARRLADLTPGDLRYTIFAVGGGEAIDTAIKIARKATGRRRVLSALGGYHGHTGLAVAAGDAKFRSPFLCDSEDFTQVPFNDLAALDKHLTEDFAAVILETIPATLGMPMPAPGYLEGVRRLASARGALYIADEVQTGLGRTGRLWGVEHWGVEPDVLVTAKGLSGGVYPIAATVVTPALEAVFHDDPFAHISTFGGSELGCAVAERVLDLTTAPGFLANVEDIAAQIADGVAAVRAKRPKLLVELRHKGLMMGLQLAGPELGYLMMRTCYEAGLFCFVAGNDTSVLQFLPPLIADADLAGEIVDRLDEAFALAERYTQ